ncbi:RNA polymerase sigma factor [Desulfosporosinus nitroreducens]|uniref:RNA polymerase sigma factor n=1 Tax=Desulfosporosinus nitroreducens TaxID=2018668 RepID=A0ABT8QT40_9FIRM|nr:sigma-70 family RNA polymerase sigma factor [Desulfosporosinus nitroreducens]MDO0824497.1 sigma-70 family RNA polymerase sigma factor [Desulfosporosinus nitroreducens]
MSKEILTELYEKQAKIIYRYLLKYGCRKEEAEEIVQESFIKAIQHIDGVDERKLPAWIFTVALNTYRNYLKRKSVITELSIDGGGFFSRLAAEGDFTQDILRDESSTPVRDCLSRLKDGYRDLLILKYEMDLSYKEIGRLLGLSEVTVKTYLYRARKEFKRLWREEYGRS